MGMANDKPTTYKAKRDFRQTREPSGHLEPRMPELNVLAVVWDCLIGAIREGARISPSRDQRVSRRRDLRWDKAMELAEAGQRSPDRSRDRLRR